MPLTANEKGQGFPSSQIYPAGAKMELYHLVLMERGDTELLHMKGWFFKANPPLYVNTELHGATCQILNLPVKN